MKPLDVEGLEGFVFLSVFSWINRKAWDILLRAWFAEFKARDDVTLLLKTDAAISPGGHRLPSRGRVVRARSTGDQAREGAAPRRARPASRDRGRAAHVSHR